MRDANMHFYNPLPRFALALPPHEAVLASQYHRSGKTSLRRHWQGGETLGGKTYRNIWHAIVFAQDLDILHGCAASSRPHLQAFEYVVYVVVAEYTRCSYFLSTSSTLSAFLFPETKANLQDLQSAIKHPYTRSTFEMAAQISLADREEWVPFVRPR